MCGEIVKTGADVHDFQVGDKVIVCSVMPVWRSMEAQDGRAKQRQDNKYAGVDYPTGAAPLWSSTTSGTRT